MVGKVKSLGVTQEILLGFSLVGLMLLALMFPFEDLGSMEIVAAWLIPFFIFKSLRAEQPITNIKNVNKLCLTIFRFYIWPAICYDD